MKKYILIGAAFLVFQCGRKQAETTDTQTVTDTIAADTTHTSQNSINYLGRYQGVLPCADCPGIETTIELTEDFNYVLTRKYLERKVKPFTETGTFKWNGKGDGIILSGSADEPVRYLVGENKLIQLDRMGNKIEGNLADKYVLTKMTEAQAVKDVSDNKQPEKLSGEWVITELEGKSVKSTGKKENSLTFRGDGGFGAFGGCNSMGGQYEQNGNKLKLSKIMSTMMACPDMSTEDQLKKTLEAVDNFVKNDDILLLRKNGDVVIKLQKKS